MDYNNPVDRLSMTISSRLRALKEERTELISALKASDRLLEEVEDDDLRFSRERKYPRDWERIRKRNRKVLSEYDYNEDENCKPLPIP